MALNRRRSCRSSPIPLVIATVVAIGALVSSPARSAQVNGYPEAFTRLEPGMVINVRTQEPIDTRSADNHVYAGVIEQEVWGHNGRLAIPRGSPAELVVRRTRDDSLVLDLESVTVRGQRYAIRTDPNRVTGTTGTDEVVGTVLGSISGGAVQGPQVHVPRSTSIAFRLERSLEVGIPDRGHASQGSRYHDYYDRDHDRF